MHQVNKSRKGGACRRGTRDALVLVALQELAVEGLAFYPNLEPTQAVLSKRLRGLAEETELRVLPVESAMSRARTR